MSEQKKLGSLRASAPSVNAPTKVPAAGCDESVRGTDFDRIARFFDNRDQVLAAKAYAMGRADALAACEALAAKWGADALGVANFGRAEAFRECITDLRDLLSSQRAGKPADATGTTPAAARSETKASASEPAHPEPAMEALGLLVAAKRRKDEGLKDATYERLRDEGWRKAFAIMSEVTRCGHCGGPVLHDPDGAPWCGWCRRDYPIAPSVGDDYRRRADEPCIECKRPRGSPPGDCTGVGHSLTHDALSSPPASAGERGGDPDALPSEDARCHDLKTWPDPFAAIWDRRKPYEIRRDDRRYEVGDCLHLREWKPGADVQHHETGRWINAVVTYKTPGGEWGLPPGLCVLGIRETARAPASGERSPRAGTAGGES